MIPGGWVSRKCTLVPDYLHQYSELDQGLLLCSYSKPWYLENTNSSARQASKWIFLRPASKWRCTEYPSALVGVSYYYCRLILLQISDSELHQLATELRAVQPGVRFLSPISEVNYQWTSNWWSATVCHCAAVKMGIGVKCHAVHWVRRANSESTIKSRVLGTPQCAPRYKAPSRSLEVGETRAPPDWLYRFPSSLKSHFHISGCCGAWLTVQKKSDLLFPSNESLSPPLFRVQTLSLRKSCTVYSKQLKNVTGIKWFYSAELHVLVWIPRNLLRGKLYFLWLWLYKFADQQKPGERGVSTPSPHCFSWTGFCLLLVSV